MLQDMFGRELNLFRASREQVVAALQEERDYLQAAADAGKLSGNLIAKKNQQLGTYAAHVKAGDKFMDALGIWLPILGNQIGDTQQLKYQISDLKQTNEKMEMWLRSLGKDLSLLPYIKQSDFRYV